MSTARGKPSAAIAKPPTGASAITASSTASTQTVPVAADQIHPLIPGHLQLNAGVLSRVRNLTSPVLGAASGVLGLTSYAGFGVYVAGQLLVTALFTLLVCSAPSCDGDLVAITHPAKLPPASGPFAREIEQRRRAEHDRRLRARRRADAISKSLKLPAGDAAGGSARYFGTEHAIWLDALLNGSITGYLLTWTLFYGLVHGKSTSEYHDVAIADSDSLQLGAHTRGLCSSGGGKGRQHVHIDD